MQPSTVGPGALPPVTELPEATRESQLRRWDIPHEYACDASEAGHPAYAEDWLASGGWSVFRVRDGVVATHRGVLHPDEYVDANVLTSLVEDAFGFSLDQVSAVYRQGRKSPEQLALRDRIDARILAVREAGGNMVELAKALGLGLRSHGESSRVVDGALARARAARGSRMGVAA